MVIPGASTDLMDKAGHLTVFCAWDHSLYLLITPALLMRPGIGRNMSYTVDDLVLHQGLLYFREIDCSYIHVWRMPRRWALSPTTHCVNVFVVACVVVFSQGFWTSKGKVLCTRFTWVEWLILQFHGEFGKHYKYVGILKSFFSHTVLHFRGVWPSHWIMGCIQVQSWGDKYNVPGSVCSLHHKKH